MKDESTAEDIVTLLEQHWSDLQQELGGHSGAFIDSYRAIVRPLRLTPDRDTVAEVMKDVEALLRAEIKAGRWRWLDNEDLLRLGGSGVKAMPDSVPVRSIGNRLLELAGPEESQPDEREQDETPDVTDHDQR